jgi:hypothetical protein
MAVPFPTSTTFCAEVDPTLQNKEQRLKKDKGGPKNI